MIMIHQAKYFDDGSLLQTALPHPQLIVTLRKKENHSQLYFMMNEEPRKEVVLFENEETNKLMIHFDHEPSEKRFPSIPMELKATKEMYELSRLLFTYYKSDDEYEVDLMLSLLVQKACSANSDVLCENRAYLDLMEFLLRNVNRQLTIDDMCKAINVTPMSLTRLCNKMSGLSPKRLFRKIQCQEARRLLEETSFSIQTISEYLGFKNTFHFSEVFKRTIGKSPAEVRKEAFDSPI